MLEPKYQLTDRIIRNIAKLEVDRTSIAVQATSNTVRAKMEKRSKSLNLFHLAHMIGANVSLKDSEKLTEGKKLAFEDLRSTILSNFRNALEFNRSNIADSYMDIDVNVMTHLNKIILTGWKETWESKVRSAGEEIDPAFDNWVELRDKNIDPMNLYGQLQEVLDWYKSSQSQVYFMIRLAVMSYGILNLAPFIAANKLTVLAIIDFMLCKKGYASSSYAAIIRGFDLNEEEFLDAWQTSAGGSDLTNWVHRFILSVGNDISETMADFSKILSDQEDGNKQPFLDLNKRQLKVLRYLQTIPTVKREDYCQMMDVSTMTAFRDLNDLVDKKLVKIGGQGRGTKYMLYNK